jgi:hypothetical protein
MVYQGDAHDIDPQSSTGRVVHNDKQDMMLIQTPDGAELATRVMQELRIGEQQEQPLRQNGTNGHLQPDQSSSRLTDMLNGVSPRRDDLDNRFQPHCPSAVPSPLYKAPVPVTPLQAMPPRLNSPRLLGSVRTPKSIDDHFYMTNEHLDVVGKSNWDQIETLKKELHETFNHRHGQLVTTVEKHVHDIKLQVDSVNEKSDRATEQGHNIHTKLEKLFDFIKDDVMGALAAQDKKATSMDQSVKELQKTVQNMQKVMEQRQSEARMSQQQPPSASASHPSNSPFPHRSQPSLVGYYGNMTESGREGQPPMPTQTLVPQMPERGSSLAYDGHNDTRAGYGGNYGQQWPLRPPYQGRNGKDDRPYSGTNPYQFTNGAANGGQYGNGYNGDGFSPYSPQEPHYAFHQGPAK